MAERYYAPELTDSLTDWVLEGDEAHHLLRVRRGKVGETAQLFNGSGLRAEAEILETGKRTANLKITGFHHSPIAGGLVLGSAPPKGDRLLWMIEKCTELGVASWTPILSERTVVHPGETKIDKLRRKVIEACKQCGRDGLMEIREPTALSAFLASKPKEAIGWILDPSGPATTDDGKPNWICVGPEGGWTDTELAVARDAGWRPQSLPGHILRIETACVAAAALALQ
jgi:16S rRNA (uracil1498-N3)-methyltransferase